MFTHLKSPRGPLPQLAGEGGAIGRRKTPVVRRAMAPDGVWPVASGQVGLRDRHRKPASIHSCFPHPIRRYAAPSPLRGEGGSRRTPAGSKTCVNAVGFDPGVAMTAPPLTPGLAAAYGFASFGNPLICVENPWKIVGIAWKILGFSFELTWISLSESSLFKGLR